MATPFVFVDVGKNSIMVDDVAMFSNPLIAPVVEEEFKVTLLDMNVLQWSCEKESSRRVVCTRVDHSA